VSVAADKTI